MIQIDNKDVLAKELENGKCVVKISTASCGPCRAVKGYMDDLEKEYADVKFIDIDAEECDEEIISDFAVRGVPVVMCFKDGERVDKTVGLQTKDQLKQRLENLN